jgi:hypothetical protein
MPEVGYCTVEDVRRALRAADLPGDAAQDRQIVVDTITGQTEWLQNKTSRHFYAPDGIEEDTDDLVPTAPKTVAGEELDVPSSPHASSQQMQVAASRQARYPRRTNGPFTRVRLGKHYVDSLTKLEVCDSSGQFTDWVADNSKTEDEDYRLYVEPGSVSSPSYVDLRARALPRLSNYEKAVRVSYDYGLDELPDTVRRAVAMKAAAELVTGDDAAMGIPENANLVAPETKVQALERQAEEKLEAYQ